MLYLLCDIELWLWLWILKVKFKKKSSIIGIRGWIDMETKWCELIGCWTQVVTLNFDLTHDLDIRFFKAKLLIAIFYEWKVDWLGMKCELDKMLDTQRTCSCATVHGKYIGQVMGRCETVTVSNLLAHEWAVHSLIKGLRGVVVLWMPC